MAQGSTLTVVRLTDSHIAEILLKVALNTMTLTLKHHSTNVGFLITGTMLMEILREREIIIQKKN
jgi:hypothetical protein